VVVEDSVGLLKDAAAFYGDEFGITGAGTDQVDLQGHTGHPIQRRDAENTEKAQRKGVNRS
jgi:hypothetical protein